MEGMGLNGVLKKVIVLALFLGGILSAFLITDHPAGTYSEQNVAYNTMVCIDENEPYLGALLVKKNGEETIVVPLIRTLTSMGAEVRWNGYTTAILRYKAKKYAVDLGRISLIPLYGWSDDLLLPLPGGLYRSRAANGDILIEYALFAFIARQMGMNIVSVDLTRTPQCLTIISEN